MDDIPPLCLPLKKTETSWGDELTVGINLAVPKTLSSNDSWGDASNGAATAQWSDPSGDNIQLENLEVIQKLGKGASGTVHLVQDKTTDLLYALKDIQLSMEEESRRLIGNELAINHKVTSDFIVRCYQSFFTDGHIKIVLQYMDGGTLADILKRRGRIEEKYLAGISRQALLGFKDLQESKVIHRDIKPSNLLVNSCGDVRISDFGVSRALENTSDCGKTFAGTYTYMSPERIQGGHHSYSTDIWALGLTILECAIGRFPYDPPRGGVWSNYFELLSRIQNSPAPSPPPNDFSSEFCDFIDACLQKDPDQRASASELLGHPFIRMYPTADIKELLPQDEY